MVIKLHNLPKNFCSEHAILTFIFVFDVILLSFCVNVEYKFDQSLYPIIQLKTR
jgi:hypothetical protein